MEIDTTKTALVVGQVPDRKKRKGLTRYEWAYEMLFVPGLEDAYYVEGWVVLPNRGLLTESAWVEWEGYLLDFAFLEEKAIYCPGPRFDREAAKQGRYSKGATMKRGELPIVWRRGWGGADDPDYIAAWLQAYELQLGLPNMGLGEGIMELLDGWKEQFKRRWPDYDHGRRFAGDDFWPGEGD